MIDNILVIIFLTIKKIDINKINLKMMNIVYNTISKKSTRKLRQKSTKAVQHRYLKPIFII